MPCGMYSPSSILRPPAPTKIFSNATLSGGWLTPSRSSGLLVPRTKWGGSNIGVAHVPVLADSDSYRHGPGARADKRMVHAQILHLYWSAGCLLRSNSLA